MQGLPRYFDDLGTLLVRLGGAAFGAYKRLSGRRFTDRGLTLQSLRVQSDPFAPPSLFSLTLAADVARLPRWVLAPPIRRVAAADFLHRAIYSLCRRWSHRRGSGHSGELEVPRPGQEVLRRSTVTVHENGEVEIRIGVGLPADGRRIRSRDAVELLCQVLPFVALRGAVGEYVDASKLRRQVETVEDAEWLREQLSGAGLVAFVADGSILPRRSGVDDRPMPEEQAVQFESPPSLRVSFVLPNRGEITGMGIRCGVTLIAGGAYHGKSTLLRAIERGVYNHIPDDGREFVVTCRSAAKIRAEDGRSVAGTDISNFIVGLPTGESTSHFFTQAASGSTSQAAAIIEALEVGAECLLIDEDTSATNLMVRDARMQRLVPEEYEPITPYVDRVRTLAVTLGVSTVMVVGGIGDYLDVADTVLCMRAYRAVDMTDTARRIAAELPTGRQPVNRPWHPISERRIVPASVSPARGGKKAVVKARGVTLLDFGTERIDLSAVEQIVEQGQVQAIGLALARAAEEWDLSRLTPAECAIQLEKHVREHGLDWLDPRRASRVSEVRAHEIAAALNRLRSLRTRP